MRVAIIDDLSLCREEMRKCLYRYPVSYTHLEYLEGFSQLACSKEIRYFQLDVGYCTSIGDWLEPSERFPEGLEEAFQEIKKAGYIPGIWVGAFMVGNRSRLYGEHPDWVLHDWEGNPKMCIRDSPGAVQW